MFLGEFGLMLPTALLKDHVKFRHYECNYKPHSHKHINCANVACFFFFFILYKSISRENYVQHEIHILIMYIVTCNKGLDFGNWL